MRKRLLPICTLILLGGCTSERIVYRPVTVPAGLTTVVQKPIKPDAETATQKDISIFLIEQNAAIDYCNARLQVIKKWSGQYEKTN